MNTNINVSNLEAFARIVLGVAVAGVVVWASSSANLTPFMSGTLALIISGIAGVLENSIKKTNGGSGLFGVVH